MKNALAVAACAAAFFLQTATGHAASGQVPTSPGAAETNVHPLDRNDLEAWLDGMVPYALKAGDIGAVVVVVKDGAVLFEKGYGYADVGKKA